MLRRFLCAILILFVTTSVRAVTTADNLLLIINKNVPDSRKLAEHYAQQRNVPAGRIVEVDVGIDDNITADQFDQQIVAPVRAFIIANKLEKQVTCLVTFYGLPLRILGRSESPELRAEIISIRAQLNAATKQAKTLTEGMEALAKETDPAFTPLVTGNTEPPEALPRRAERTAAMLLPKLQQLPPGPARDALEGKLKAFSEAFHAPVKLPDVALKTIAPTSQPATTQPALTPQEVQARMAEFAARRGDPAARLQLRNLARQSGGVFVYAQILAAQELYLDGADSESALDNELALLNWGLYPRTRWQLNSLNYKYAAMGGRPVLAVMRLDGGSADQVRAMIDTSIKVENEGLQGKVVLDSRGIAPSKPDGSADAYGMYDQTIRNLQVLLHSRTKLDLLVDDRPALIPPGSVKDCAIYCGWYSPGEYVPSVALVPGAVAVHIASFEMTTLHGGTRGWCRNLLDAGAAVTLGPVSEPYLHAFPAADELFPLLMTGKLPLVDVYWRTNPLVSWRIAIVGDPLYTPFKKNPAITMEDLPAPLSTK